MKVYLLKNIEKVGLAGEILTVSEGYAQNYLFPRKLALLVTAANEAFFLKKVKTVEHRKEVVSSETSMLAEKIKDMVITIKKKTHDDNRLYAALNPADIVDLLAENNIKVSKSQIIFDKAIKSIGSFSVTIKLSSKLQPALTVKVMALAQ